MCATYVVGSSAVSSSAECSWEALVVIWHRRLVLAAIALIAAMAGLTASAGAVLSGTNGRILFISGRGAPNDATAKPYLRPTIGSVGGGIASPVATATGSGQHRHPTWSPDRTMIAYAQGDNATANYDIYILDLTNPAGTPQNITNSNAVTDDRPAWSPDGSTIAFESENADASGQINIKLYDVASQNATNFTSTAAGTYEHKPAWTPDSQTLFYVVGNPTGSNMDIVRQSIAGGGPSNVLASPASNEFQPSVSPDGTHLCFTHDTGAGFNATARVRVSLLNGGGQTELPGNSGVPGYNCTWSPDGTKIAYVQGLFSAGDLVMENSDLSNGLIPLEQTVGRFDGNPDWAPDGRPQCEDETVKTDFNKPVKIPMLCRDTGPAYEQTPVRAFATSDAGPTNGTVTTDVLELPAKVTYTPNPGFAGSDSFQVSSFDEVAFGDRKGTVKVKVRPDNMFSFSKVKKNVKKGSAKLSVKVPGPGELEVAKSNKLKRTSKRASSKGSVKLKIASRGKGKKKLKEKGGLKVRADVSYRPDGGSSRTKTKKLTLKLK
jgi:dipeptidyl aminopeptidase/acylaminoacyl peptidase